MKKRFYLLVALIAMCIGISSVRAIDYGVIALADAYTEACTSDGNGNTICTPKIVFGPGSYYLINTFEIEIFVSNATMDNNITYGGGLYQISRSQPIATTKNGISGKTYTLVVGSRKDTWGPGTITLGTFKFTKDDTPCKVIFTLNEPTFEKRNFCEKVDGYYYDKNGYNVNEAAYRLSCFLCKKDDINGKYYGKLGQDLPDYQAWYDECGDKKYCEIDGTTYYGADGSIVSKLKYYEECEKPRCDIVVDGETKEYYDIDGNKTTEDEYRKSCFYCKIDKTNNKYYGTSGKEVSELDYSKQCTPHSCEILSDGTHYDKDGKVVTEDEYLKSCFKCRKENDKYYDENGKETTKENWDIMCTPHKCESFGDKYFNDKGVLVSKEEYDKACTNPQTGSTDKNSIAYVISGLLFAGTIIYISARYSKLRKI